MAVKVPMPKLSDTMEEGVIAGWKVQEGDSVESGDVIAEVETDKATMEMEVFDSGVIRKLLVSEGDTVPLGNTVAVIGEEDEDISDLLNEIEQEQSGAAVEAGKEEAASESAGAAPQTESVPQSEPSTDTSDEVDVQPQPQPSAARPAADTESGNGRIKASPLARNMAEDRGIDLARVDGSGPGGRIIKRDIEEYKEKGAGVPTSEPAAYASRESKEVRVSQMRKTIAKRLAESKFTYPHYYETVEIDMERAIAAREEMNEVSDVKISFNDLVVKAASLALQQHPWVNSTWNGDTITQHGEIHVAVAVAVEEGLLTPVIRNTDQKGIRSISSETKALAERAKNKDLDMNEMEGSTFTVSNLGMFGIEEFTAIINPPNACIMAVGAIQDKPVVKDGEVVPGKRMKVTLSSDHRIVDGAKAADFLNTFRQLLENPMSMML